MRKSIEVQIVKNYRRKLSLLQKPNCKGFRIFDNDLVAINKAKFQLEISKPTYVFCVHELSKHIMFDFHYNFIKTLYWDKARLLFNDTDSLMYEIKTNDVSEEIILHKDLFDFAVYPRDSTYFSPTNNKVIGKFKDETAGKPIIEFF